jgi:hypothetical protein
MGLGARARRLVANRGIGGGAVGPSRGLAWCDVISTVDRDSLGDGARVVVDVTVTFCAWPRDVDRAELRERVASSPDDRGRVFAWNGAEIGVVRQGKKGGMLFDFRWPEGLPSSDPGV